MGKEVTITFEGALEDRLRPSPALRERLAEIAAWEDASAKNTPPEGDFFINQAIQDVEVYAGKRSHRYNFGGGVD